MTAPPPGPDQLLAAYADDPAALTADERARVEGWLAEDPGAPDELERSREALAAVRALAPDADEPDWDRMADGIGRQVRTRARRRRTVVGGAALVAAAATAAALVSARPWTGPDQRSTQRAVDGGAPPDQVPGPASDHRIAAPDQADVEDDLGGVVVDDPLGSAAYPDDLGGAATIDPDLLDAVVATADDPLDLTPFDPAGAPAAEPGDVDALLPDGGWIDELTDDELERALQWLEQVAPSPGDEAG